MPSLATVLRIQPPEGLRLSRTCAATAAGLLFLLFTLTALGQGTGTPGRSAERSSRPRSDGAHGHASVYYSDSRLSVWLWNDEPATVTISISVYEVPLGGAMDENPWLQREAYGPISFTLPSGTMMEALMAAPDCAIHVAIYNGEHISATELAARSYAGEDRQLLSREFDLDRRCPGNNSFLPLVVTGLGPRQARLGRPRLAPVDVKGEVSDDN